MVINTTGMRWLKWLFHVDDNRINNTGWMIKRWWNGGVERIAKLLRECWTFLTHIFLHQQLKQYLQFALAKLREICKYLAGACNSNSHARGLHYLTFVWKTRQGKQRNEASRLRKCFKRAQCYHLLGMRRSLFANWIHYIATKKPQPLCENWNEKGIGEQRNCGHRLIMHSITRRDEMGGGGEEWSEKTVGGGGGRAAALHQLIYKPGGMVWQYT